MQISSDKSISLLSTRATANNITSVNQANTARVERIQSNTTNNSNASVENNTARVQRFDVDEQAIALIEQEFQSNSGNSLGGEITQSEFNFSAQSQNRQANSFEAIRDTNQSAVATYESIDTLSNRENIQQLFGVDLYA